MRNGGGGLNAPPAALRRHASRRAAEMQAGDHQRQALAFPSLFMTRLVGRLCQPTRRIGLGRMQSSELLIFC
jgi:hypothetical protein